MLLKDNSYAYITVLTTLDYLSGVKALNKGLLKVKSKYPLFVFIPEDKEELFAPYLKKYKIDYIIGDNYIVPENLLSENHYWNQTFFKLNVARLTQFDKIVLLDSDMLVLRNLDHLFEKPHLTACVAGKYLNPDWVLFNSGLLVIKPDEIYAQKLVDSIPKAIERRKLAGLPCGDQDVFQEACLNWDEFAELHLPEQYNVFSIMLDELCANLFKDKKDIYIVHFIGAKKPWHLSKSDYSKKLKRLKNSNKHIERYMLKKYKSYCK